MMDFASVLSINVGDVIKFFGMMGSMGGVVWYISNQITQLTVKIDFLTEMNKERNIHLARLEDKLATISNRVSTLEGRENERF